MFNESRLDNSDKPKAPESTAMQQCASSAYSTDSLKAEPDATRVNRRMTEQQMNDVLNNALKNDSPYKAGGVNDLAQFQDVMGSGSTSAPAERTNNSSGEQHHAHRHHHRHHADGGREHSPSDSSNSGGSASNSDGHGSKCDGPAHKPNHKPEAPTPSPEHPAPKPEVPAPKPNPSPEAPAPEQPVPKPEAPAPKPSPEAPAPEQPAPTPEVPAPKPNPNPDAPAPEKPTPKPEVPAPNPEVPPTPKPEVPPSQPAPPKPEVPAPAPADPAKAQADADFKAVVALEGPGGVSRSSALLDKDLKQAQQQFGADSKEYKNYANEMAKNLQGDPASLKNLALGFGKQHLKDYDIDGNGMLNKAEMNLAIKTESDPTKKAMLESLNSQYDAIRKGESPAFPNLAPEGITANGLKIAVDQSDKSLTKQWKKDQDAEVNTTPNATSTAKDVTALMSEYNPHAAAKRLDRDIAAAQQAYGAGSPEYNSYMQNLQQELSKDPTTFKALTAAWAQENMSTLDVTGDKSLTQGELSLQSKTATDALTKSFIDDLSQQYSTLKNAHYDGTFNFPSMTPDPDKITIQDLTSYADAAGKSMHKQWTTAYPTI